MDLKKYLVMGVSILCLCSVSFGIGRWYQKHITTTAVSITTVKEDATTEELKETVKESIPSASSSTVTKIVERIEATKPAVVKKTEEALTDTEVEKVATQAVPTVTNIVQEKKDEHTTNVYAIDASKKAQHGIGLYAGRAFSDRSYDFGLTYRNRRMFYQAGYSTSHSYSVRIGYEVAQW